MVAIEEGRSNFSNLDQNTVYGQLCESYRAIDNFRMGLLGLLPLASGLGIFLLLQKDSIPYDLKTLFFPTGIFGFAITLGLMFFEVYGIRKCGALIQAGKKMEQQSKVLGQYTCRPPSIGYHINEPFASGIIYPAVLASWVYMALHFESSAAPRIAIAIFVIGFMGMLAYNIHLGETKPDPRCEDE
jgi:hypothetical protein